MIGLIWNSMMSMAGGWFFLTTIEAFTLKDRDFRLPGLGSYMNEAMQDIHDPTHIRAIIGGSVAMILMIVAFDQLLWRPLVVWSQKFKIEENTEAKTPQSWLLSMFRHSFLLDWFSRLFKSERPKFRIPFSRFAHKTAEAVEHPTTPGGLLTGKIIRWGVALAALALAVYGLFALIMLIIRVPLWGSRTHDDWVAIILALLASFARTSGAVIIRAIWTLPVGIIIGRSPRLSNIFQPIIQTLASYPAPMIFPIVVAVLFFFHSPFNLGCVILLLMGAQWYVLFNVIAGAMAIPGELKEVCEAYSMPKFQQLDQTLYSLRLSVSGDGPDHGGGRGVERDDRGRISGSGPWRHPGGVRPGRGEKSPRPRRMANFPVLAASTISMAVFVVLINRFFWKHLYRLAENRYSMNT